MGIARVQREANLRKEVGGTPGPPLFEKKSNAQKKARQRGGLHLGSAETLSQKNPDCTRRAQIHKKKKLLDKTGREGGENPTSKRWGKRDRKGIGKNRREKGKSPRFTLKSGNPLKTD